MHTQFHAVEWVVWVAQGEEVDVSILNGIITAGVAARLDNGACTSGRGTTEDIHHLMLNTVSFIRIHVVTENPEVVCEAQEIVRIHVLPKFASLFEVILLN